jgi:hypothetical protein
MNTGFFSTWLSGRRGALSLMAMWVAWISPVRGQVSFSQVDYYQDGSLAVADSEWGQLDVSYSPGGGFQYLNVVIDPGLATERWVAQNIALLPAAVVGAGPFGASYYFDLGVARGTDVSSLNIGYSVSGGPVAAPSGLSTGVFAVGQSVNIINAGVPSGIGTLNAPVAPAFAWLGPLGLSDLTWPAGMPNVTQEKNFCGPGAAANSLHWLNAQNGLGLTQSLAATQSELAGNMGNNNTGNWDDAEVQGKLQYIIEHQLPLEVHYVGGEKLPTAGGYVEPGGNGTAQNDGAVSWDWLVREMARGQDIEIMTGTHWVVVEGTLTIGGNHFFSYRDDPYQKGGATTAAQQRTIDNRHVWTYFQNGMTNIGNGNERIRAMVAESPIPEPSTYGLLGALLLLAAIGTRGRRR